MGKEDGGEMSDKERLFQLEMTAADAALLMYAFGQATALFKVHDEKNDTVKYHESMDRLRSLATDIWCTLEQDKARTRSYEGPQGQFKV
jgi:hypothetical protein